MPCHGLVICDNIEVDLSYAFPTDGHNISSSGRYDSNKCAIGTSVMSKTSAAPLIFFNYLRKDNNNTLELTKRVATWDPLRENRRGKYPWGIDRVSEGRHGRYTLA
jgi:hypothetical protein